MKGINLNSGEVKPLHQSKRRRRMKWITREYVKVDRVACPWLIKNFVDKDAEFVFVPTEKVMDEAKRLEAIPYDVKNVELGHHGKECSFEAILKKYKLTDDGALVLLGNRPIAVYCICGFQVSGTAVTELRQRGYDARALVGGITAWHAIGGSTVPLDTSTYEQAQQ